VTLNDEKIDYHSTVHCFDAASLKHKCETREGIAVMRYLSLAIIDISMMGEDH
jgi:hypothetical protein